MAWYTVRLSAQSRVQGRPGHTPRSPHLAARAGVGLGPLLALTPYNDPDSRLCEYAANLQTRKNAQGWGMLGGGGHRVTQRMVVETSKGHPPPLKPGQGACRERVAGIL